MGSLKFVGVFIQYTLLPCILLLVGAYFILFANTKIERPLGLKVLGNIIAAAIFIVIFAIFSAGVYSMTAYNAKMCQISGMNPTVNK